jgi:hypothetical protein
MLIQSPKGGSGDPFRDRRTFLFRNQSLTEVPAYGVMLVSGVDADGVLTVTRPDADEIDPSMLVFNTEFPVAADAEGLATCDAPHFAAVDGSPGVGDGLGTQEDSWELALDQRGFRAWGAAADGVCLVMNRYRAIVGVQCVDGEIVGDFLESTQGDDLRPVAPSLDFRWPENSGFISLIVGDEF